MHFSSRALITVFACLVLGLPVVRADNSVSEVTADPAAIYLNGPCAGCTLLVQGHASDGRTVDLTHAARYTCLDPRIALVSETGRVRAVADGHTTVLADVAGRQISIPVRIVNAARPRSFNFANDILPVLSKLGCNSAGCHGKAEGQNGFKLSVFGFDPAADYAALTKEARGRRVFLSAPEHSLLVAKPSGTVPHGGGIRLALRSSEYETLRAWIAAGTPYGSPQDPSVLSIQVEPQERTLAMRGQQQLRVRTRYSDGREVDVTPLAKFQTNNEGLASVSGGGLVIARQSPGDVAIMASFSNSVAVFRALIPRSEAITPYPHLPESNFIDALVFAKLRKLNLLPSDPADDAEFLRRVYLDVIGTLPTAEEARRFLGDARPDRRARLVDELFDRPEFADYWSLKWADLLRVDREALSHKRAYAFYRWIRESLATNKPFDQFVRELVTAAGPLNEVGPAPFFKVVARPGDEASTLSQVFLGIRLACAECHHHPFDRWSQSDYFGMQAFFTPLSIRGGPDGEELTSAGASESRNPRTNDVIYAHELGTPAPAAAPSGDHRVKLASWLTATDNPWLARNLANRLVAHFLGRGLVEPVDDVRATNPPTNPALLDVLARHLIDSRYNFRELIRTITASRTYQLSSRPNAANACDEQNYSRARLKRLDAEVLLDMVCQTTGVGEKFPGVPSGYRAIQLWDSKVPHYFLKLFGRPVRASVCECERNHEPSVSQVLHLLNSSEIHAKLSHEGGTIARLMRRPGDDPARIDELYLIFFSRYPSEQERAIALDYLRTGPPNRRQALEDLAWSMLNSLEFLFNH
jgi:hypothetical protein